MRGELACAPGFTPVLPPPPLPLPLLCLSVRPRLQPEALLLQGNQPNKTKSYHSFAKYAVHTLPPPLPAACLLVPPPRSEEARGPASALTG